MSNIAYQIDKDALQVLAEQLVNSAGGMPGDFVFATIDAQSNAIRHRAIANDDSALDAIFSYVSETGAQPGTNVYFAGSLFRSGSVNGHGGRKKENIVGVLCAVTDFDAKNDPATRHKRLPLSVGSEIETSPGNFQCHYWLDRPSPAQECEPTLHVLANAAGADDCKTPEHLWRVPGTWNWPNSKKIATGRASEPFQTRWEEMPDTWNTVSLDELRSALPRATHSARNSRSGPFDWHQRLKPREPLDRATIVRALSKEGDRSVQAFKLIRRLHRAGYSPHEVLAELLDNADLPVMTHYGDPVDEDRVRKEVQRAYTKPDDTMAQRYARMMRIANSSTDDARADASPPREIRLQGGSHPAIVDEAEQALVEQNIGIFQRGSMLVRPGELLLQVRGGHQVSDLVLVPVCAPELVEHMTSAAVFLRWDARRNDWSRINCPKDVAETLLARVGRWRLRPLIATINAPTMRADGSLLDRPGYDQETGLLYDPRGLTFPTVLKEPTLDEARRALAILQTLLVGFPFASREAHSVALAGLLTACIRRSLPTAPIFGIDGTGPGTGKGLLADTIAVIGNGRAASPITAGAGEEELEKRIASMLLRGDLAICIDNLDRPLESSFLCSALTQEAQSVRILGQSKTVTLPTNCLFLATGNGLTFAGDMWRRGLNCLIDPAMERPSERTFDFNPLELVKRDRGKYVAAALTVLRGYWSAGRPEQDGKRMGSFETWSRAVRDPLLWLGEADPVATCQPASDDPERERFAAVIEGWKTIIGEDRGVTLKQAIEEAEKAVSERPPRKAFHEALHAVAAPMVRGGEHRVDARRLGYWMRRMKRQVIRGRRLVPEGESHAGVRWRLEVAHNGQDEARR